METKTNAMIDAINVVANKWNEGDKMVYLGVTIKITRKQEPQKIVRWSNVANAYVQKCRSARYWGEIIEPNGKITKFEEMRSGAIVRKFAGVYVRYENEDMQKQGEFWQIHDRRKKIED